MLGLGLGLKAKNFALALALALKLKSLALALLCLALALYVVALLTSRLQMLLLVQIDAHYDEQKELLQQQLVVKQQMISDVDRLYSVSRYSRTCYFIVLHCLLFHVCILSSKVLRSYVKVEDCLGTFHGGSGLAVARTTTVCV